MNTIYLNIICGGALLSSSVLAVVGITNYNKHNEIKQNLISQLIPYVEMSDKETGISLDDQLDFVKRSGISTSEIVLGDHFNLNNFSTSNLENALASYKAEKK